MHVRGEVLWEGMTQKAACLWAVVESGPCHFIIHPRHSTAAGIHLFGRAGRAPPEKVGNGRQPPAAVPRSEHNAASQSLCFGLLGHWLGSAPQDVDMQLRGTALRPWVRSCGIQNVASQPRVRIPRFYGTGLTAPTPNSALAGFSTETKRSRRMGVLTQSENSNHWTLPCTRAAPRSPMGETPVDCQAQLHAGWSGCKVGTYLPRQDEQPLFPKRRQPIITHKLDMHAQNGISGASASSCPTSSPSPGGELENGRLSSGTGYFRQASFLGTYMHLPRSSTSCTHHPSRRQRTGEVEVCAIQAACGQLCPSFDSQITPSNNHTWRRACRSTWYTSSQNAHESR